MLFHSEPLFETLEFSREERVRALKRAQKIRKQIRKAAMQRKLKKFGPLSPIIASLFVYDWVQDLLLHNKHVRRLTETSFRYVTKTSA